MLLITISSSETLLPPINCHKRTNVIILGAGIAGLACAKHLLQNGVQDVLVLEAQDRMGGRLHTVSNGTFVVELGAQWIHGETKNSIYEFCKKYDLIEFNDSNPLTEGKGLFCVSNGTAMPQGIIDDILYKLDELRKFTSSDDYRHEEKPESISDVFRNKFEEYIISCNDKKTEHLKWAIYEWFIKFEKIDNSCDNLDDISTVGYCEWADSPGCFYTNLKTGFKSAIDALISDFPINTVHVSKAVKCIHWNKEVTLKKSDQNLHTGAITVECVNGDFYSTNAVVVTASVGFMQSCLNTFFIPQLPENKRTAIANIGYGTINKIFLEFGDPFWTDEEVGFQLVWLDDTDDFLMLENKWCVGITGFDRVRGQDNMLVAWVGGQEAKELEEISDDIVMLVCFRLLKKFLNRPNISMPTKIIRSSWNTNIYIKGAYSYRPKNFHDSGCNVADLAEPLYTEYLLNGVSKLIFPSVLFAGEATSKSYFATVHGAFDSGIEAASKVIKTLEMLKSIKA